MNSQSLSARFGETTAERTFGILGLIAVTIAVGSRLLDLGDAPFVAAWGFAVVSIVSWNLLVFMRRRREQP